MKIKINKIKIFLKKLPRLLGENVFTSVLVIILAELVLGAFFFYKYSFLPEKMTPAVEEETIRFEQKTYQEVLDVWIGQRKRFNQTETKDYPDLFRPKQDVGG